RQKKQSKPQPEREATRQLTESFFCFYSLRDPNVNGVRAGLAIVVATPLFATANPSSGGWGVCISEAARSGRRAAPSSRLWRADQLRGYSACHGKLDSVHANSPACQA